MLESVILEDFSMLVINLMLFFLISAVLVIYVKKIRKADIEYTKAKGLLEEIVRSFSREIQDLERKIEETNIRLENIQMPGKDQMKMELNALSSKIENLMNLYSSLEKKIERFKAEISRFINQQTADLPKQPEQDIIPKPSFYVGRERALAPLTPTELKVLEILSTEGEKTVREIRSRLGLTREHTGRLMKSLYDRGYVERRTNRIPYVYRIKREMENLLNNKN